MINCKYLDYFIFHILVLYARPSPDKPTTIICKILSLLYYFIFFFFFFFLFSISWSHLYRNPGLRNFSKAPSPWQLRRINLLVCRVSQLRRRWEQWRGQRWSWLRPCLEGFLQHAIDRWGNLKPYAPFKLKIYALIWGF